MGILSLGRKTLKRAQKKGFCISCQKEIQNSDPNGYGNKKKNKKHSPGTKEHTLGGTIRGVGKTAL